MQILAPSDFSIYPEPWTSMEQDDPGYPPLILCMIWLTALVFSFASLWGIGYCAIEAWRAVEAFS